MKIKQRKILVLCISALIFLMCILGVIINYFVEEPSREEIFEEGYKITSADDALDNGLIIREDFLTPNLFSRPGTSLTQINNIVIHYVGNPGTSAQDNRNYFESLATTGETYASSHYVVGIDGEIIQCVPLNEIAYCSNDRNNDTISIEVCHESESGEFSKKAYQSLVMLCAWLCNAYKLDSEDLIRHYDVTGKICPKYFVDYPTEWSEFKNDVKVMMKDIK